MSIKILILRGIPYLNMMTVKPVPWMLTVHLLVLGARMGLSILILQRDNQDASPPAHIFLRLVECMA